MSASVTLAATLAVRSEATGRPMLPVLPVADDVVLEVETLPPGADSSEMGDSGISARERSLSELEREPGGDDGDAEVK